eukprot:tig00000769_g4017.t1
MRTVLKFHLPQYHCDWDGANFIYCYHEHSFYRFDVATESREILTAYGYRNDFCVTFFGGSFWLAAGIGPGSTYLNDLLRYSPSSQSWTVEIPNGNSDMSGRRLNSCARQGSRFFIAQYDVYYVDLAAASPKRWTFLTPVSTGYYAGLVEYAAPCQGLLWMSAPQGGPIHAVINPADGVVEFTYNPGYPFAYPGERLAVFAAAQAAYDLEIGGQLACKIFMAAGWDTSFSPVYDYSDSLVELTVTVPAASVTWTGPSVGQVVQRGSSLNVTWSAASRSYGPASVVLTAADSSVNTPPIELGLLTSVILLKTGGQLDVPIPSLLNAGSYQLRLVPAGGNSLRTPSFTIPAWNLLELLHWEAGYEIWSNTSLPLAWTAAAWSFPLEAHLLPSNGSAVLSWSGVVLSSTYLNASESAGGNITLQLPANSTAGDYIIRILDASNQTVQSHQLTNYFVVKDNGENLRPLICSASSAGAGSVTVVSSFGFGRGIASLAANCTARPGGLFAGQSFASSRGVADADASRAVIALAVASSFSAAYGLDCAVDAFAAVGQFLARAQAGVVIVPPAAPWAPLEVAVASTNATQAAMRVRYTAGQFVTAAEVECSGFGGPYRLNASATDAVAGGLNVSLQLSPSYGGSYELACAVRVRASTDLTSPWTSAAPASVPAAAPWAPAEVTVASTNATLATLRVAFGANQSVVEVEVECDGFGGPYRTNSTAADADASGLNVSVPLSPSYSGGFDLSCSARVRASTGLVSAWTAAAARTVPAAVPWAPLDVAVFIVNATQAVARVRFTADQSVIAAEIECSGFGGPYSVNATATDAAAPGLNISIGLAPSYGGSYDLSCKARVRASTGEASAWTAAATAAVPSAAPWAPLEVAVASTNATQAAMRVRYTAGQFVTAAEVECSGFGGPYRLNASATDAVAGGLNVSLQLSPSYGGSYELACAVRVRASTDLTSPWTSAAPASVSAAAPWAPAEVTVASTNATLATLRVAFGANQSVVEVEVECDGFGGPYRTNSTAADADASGLNVSVPLSPSYSGGFDLSCSARVRASTGLVSAWTAAAARTVPAAVPWAPLDVAVFIVNATQAVARVRFTADQSVIAAEIECSGFGGPYSVNATATDAAAPGMNISMGLAPSYGGSYDLSCKARVRASTGEASAWTAAATAAVPSAAPWAPLEVAVASTNATQAAMRVRYTAGQFVAAAEVECSGFGGPYRLNASATDAVAGGLNVSLQLSPSYGGSYELACAVRVRASTELTSPWTSAAPASVPAAAPWAPAEVTVASTNATLATLRVAFGANQSVVEVEVECGGLGGPYRVNATAADADASGLNVSVPLSPSYSGGFDLSCSARVRASTGLVSAWTAAAARTVPAAVPWAPLDVAVFIVNATQAVARVRFTADQSVIATEIECSGFGGPYSVNTTATDAAAPGLNISMGLAPSYGGSYDLSCKARVRASTGEASAWKSADLVTTPAAHPEMPTCLATAAVNSTLLQFRVAFTSGQNVSQVEVECDGFGGPYLVRARVADADSGGATVPVPVSPNYFGNYTVSCSPAVLAASGLRTAAANVSLLVSAANPWAPWGIVLTLVNETHLRAELSFSAAQGVSQVACNCSGLGGPYVASAPIGAPQEAAGRVAALVAIAPQYSAGYLANCTFVARAAATGLLSPPAFASLPVPAAAPSAPRVEALAAVNATLLSLRIAFTEGQSAARAELHGAWSASCRARVVSSAGRESPWSPAATAPVPGIFLMKGSEGAAPGALAPAGARFSAAVLFRSAFGRSKLALFGRLPDAAAPAPSAAVLVYDAGMGEWTEAAARAPFDGFGMECAWDQSGVVFCAGGYVGSAAAAESLAAAAWAFPVSFEARADLPPMPVARAGHCATFHDQRLWVFGGVGSTGGTVASRNDMLSLELAGAAWGTEVRQGNLDIPPRPSPSCARLDATWYVAGASEGSSAISLHAVDLGRNAAGAGGRAFRLVGVLRRPSAPAAFRLGACQGHLYALLANSTGAAASAAAVAFLDPAGARPARPPAAQPPRPARPPRGLTASAGGADGAAEQELELELPPLEGPFLLASDCPACTAVLFGATGPPAPQSRLLSLSGTVPETKSACTRPRPHPDAPALPESRGQPSRGGAPVRLPTPAPAASAPPAAGALPSPSAGATPTPAGAPGRAAVELWLAVRATLPECEAFLRRQSLAALSQGLSRLLAAALRADLTEGRVRVADARCGSILLNVQLFEAGAASSSSSAAGGVDTSEGFILEMMANLTRAGQLLLPGLDDRPVSSMFNASFAAGAPPPGAGAAAAALARGETIYAEGRPICGRPPSSRRRAYAAASAASASVSAGTGDTAHSPAPGSLLETTGAFSALTGGDFTSVWIDFPALSGREQLDLLGFSSLSTTAPDHSGKPEAPAGAPGPSLAQRAAAWPPKPIPPALLSAVREPLAMLGEGAFGRGRRGRGRAGEREALRVIKRAVKEVSLADPEVAAREIYGARLQMACSHPNVLRCEALFADRFKLYIVLPLADLSLSALLASRDILPAHLLGPFALQIAAGMAYLHHELPRPVAHRDLKPQNILVFRGVDGAGPTLRVCDFGISRHVETAKSLRGTLVYLPPETYTKSEPTKADVWAFGIVLMEMATGAKPYRGEPIGPEQLAGGQPYAASAFAAVPEPLRPLARACLSKNPAHRPTFLEIRQRLAAALPPPLAIGEPAPAEGARSRRPREPAADVGVDVAVVTVQPDP